MANTLKIKRGAAATIPQGELAEPLFTTDTYDLYIGKGSTNGNQRFQKYIASGTSSQFLKGDGSLDSTTYQATSEKGQNNGYASLDAGGKIPVAQLPSSVIEYKGTWNASTNTPTLADGTGDAGDVYIVSVGGTQNLGSGNISFDAGDWVMYNGSVWQKSTGSNAVASVNGQTGIVVITLDQLSPMTTLGDTIYGGASGASTRLAGNITTTKKFLSQTGTGSISAAPSWETVTKTDVGLGNVENTALSTWAGSSNITTLGTITSGTWNGTTIAITNGGTGQTTKGDAFNALSPMTTLGDIIFGGTSGNGNRLAGNTTTTKKFLAQTGTSTQSASPLWDTLASGDIPNNAANTSGQAGSVANSLTFNNGGAGDASGTTFDGSAAKTISYNTIGAQAALTNPVTGTGTTNQIAYWTSSSAIGGLSTASYPSLTELSYVKGVTSAIQTQIDGKQTSSTNLTSLAGLTYASTSFVKMTAAGTFALDTNTYITGNQTITLSGDVSGSGTTAITTTIGSAKVTNDMLAGSITASKLATFGNGDAISWAANTDGAFIKFVSTGDGEGESYLQIGTTDNGNERITFTQTSGVTTYTRAYIDTDGEFYKGGGTKYVYNSGTWAISTTGSAATLTTARNFTINGTAKSFDGSANVSWTAADIGLTSYLPLTGGTLTGALSGTSATFSGNVAVGGTTNDTSGGLYTNIAIDATTYSRYSLLTGGTARARFQFDGTNTSLVSTSTGGKLQFVTTAAAAMEFFTSDTLRLTIASTGAATFSSSVTAKNVVRAEGDWSTTYPVFQTFDTRTGGAEWNIENGRTLGNLSFYSGGTKMTITSGGNVGIGTSSPSAISTYTTLDIRGATGGGIRIGKTSTNPFNLQQDGTDAYLNNVANGSMYFYTNDTERMRITSGGNVLIGKTTNAGGKLQVSNGTNTFNVDHNADGAYLTAATDNNVNYKRLSYDATEHFFLTSATERMRITSGGELLINTTTDSGDYKLQVNGNVYATAYYESSDIRLKDVITNTYSDTFSAIEFMWKDKRDDKKHWGYAAQDVMRFIPDAIETNKDGMMTVNYNEAHTWKIAQLEKEILELKAKING